MRVPDLNWPTDLFGDTVSDELYAPDRAETGSGLWPLMRQLWVRLMKGAERPRIAA